VSFAITIVFSAPIAVDANTAIAAASTIIAINFDFISVLLLFRWV
jgi:hypothetical protein